MKPEYDPNLILTLKNNSNLLSALLVAGIALFFITLAIFAAKTNKSGQNEVSSQDNVLLASIAGINALFAMSINYLLPKFIQPALAIWEKLSLKLPLIMGLLTAKILQGTKGHHSSSIPDFLLIVSGIIVIMAISALIKTINNKAGSPAIQSSIFKNNIGINIFAFLLFALTLFLDWMAITVLKPLIMIYCSSH